jgi:hypothetical protein
MADTSAEDAPFGFLIRGLGFFNGEQDEVEAQSEEGYLGRPPPHDISHLMQREYRTIVNPFIYPQYSAEDATENPDVQEDAPASDETNVPAFGEVVELSDEECVYHYDRILGGDFPWERLNEFVSYGYSTGDIEEGFLEEWQHFYGQHEQYMSEGRNAEASYNDIRFTIHDLLLWAIALDFFYDVEETGKLRVSLL